MNRDAIMDILAGERRRRKWTQRQLGQCVGLSTVSICNLERKQYASTHFATLEDIAGALGYELVLQKREEGGG